MSPERRTHIEKSVRIPGPIGWLLTMAEIGIPSKFWPGVRIGVVWSLPFIFLLGALDRYFLGTIYEVIWCVICAFLSVATAVYWDKIIPQRWQERPATLEYLSNKDADLSSAIVSMARRSAWGCWFSAQHLVLSGNAIGNLYLFHMAASQVINNILDGDLEVRGRRPGRMDYEAIPRTDWQSSSIYYVNDPISLWKMVISPKGGTEIAPDGTIVRASNAAAAARTSQIANYDSLLIDAYQFEKLWPKKNAIADKARRKFLRDAQRRGLEKDEIQRLCGQKWKLFSFLLAWFK